MSITPEQRAILARIATRRQDFAALSRDDGQHLADRRAARRERKQDRRALQASTGPIWLVPVDPVPARSIRPIRPIPYVLTSRR